MNIENFAIAVHPELVDQDARFDWLDSSIDPLSQAVALQEHVLHYTGAVGQLGVLNSFERSARWMSKGSRMTARLLEGLKGNPLGQLSVLRMAYLFPYTQSMRRDQSDQHSLSPRGRKLAENVFARIQAELGMKASPWHHLCTSALPGQEHLPALNDLMRDQGLLTRISEATLLCLVDEAVQRVLAVFTPVQWQFGPKMDMRIEHEISRKETAEAERKIALQAANAAHLARMQAVHPRYGRWGDLQAKELGELVWLKPLRAVAKDFGVSDVAVKKKCRKMGVRTPNRGHWLKGRRPGLSAES